MRLAKERYRNERERYREKLRRARAAQEVLVDEELSEPG